MVDSTVVVADGDAAAHNQAKSWAASLRVSEGSKAFLIVVTPSDKFKTFDQREWSETKRSDPNGTVQMLTAGGR